MDQEDNQAYGSNFLGMIRPTLSDQPSFTQRNNKFKSCCIIGCKFCDMRVDSGSTENYIAYIVIEELDLPVTPHPNPYSIRGVNNSFHERVTHQCLINYSFSEYEDSVLCDVINMSAADLILGRPWQYDKRSTQLF